jgi:hypothetical protein
LDTFFKSPALLNDLHNKTNKGGTVTQSQRGMPQYQHRKKYELGMETYRQGMGQSDSHCVVERTNLFVNMSLTAAVDTSVMRMAML